MAVNELTAIVSVRIEHPDRLENVLAVTRYMLEVLKISHIILIEHDLRPKLMHLLDERITYLFVRGEQPWNRSRAINTALPWVETDVLAIWDCDVILTEKAIRVSLQEFGARPDLVAMTPYNHMYFVHRQFLKGVQALSVDFASILADPSNWSYDWTGAGGAGVYLVRSQWLRHVRGPSELFWGWGCDDEEIFTRLARLYPDKVGQVTGPLLHIDHHRVEVTAEASEAALAERHRIRTWDPERIREYYGITHDLPPYLQRKYPDPPQTDDEKEAVARELGHHLFCAKMDRE